MQHVIIGNGPAGVTAAETLRAVDPQAEIVLVGDEKEPPYSRMAIPYLLNRSIGEEGTYLRKDHGHYERLRIRLLQARAEAINCTARRVTLSNGESLRYDRLLIASGSHPVRPAVPGIELPNVHPCWTLIDAREIAAKTKPGARVVQIGGGFIGCIILQALVSRGVNLTVVEMGDRMVPRMMTARAGDMIRRWIEKAGIRVHVGTRLEAIEPRDERGPMSARLSDGQAVECDLVVVAAGVRPNVGFLHGGGIGVSEGVLVDARMHTSAPDVYAAGDVTEFSALHSGQPQLNAIQINAVEQARIAAMNMAGMRATMQGSLALNVLDTVGLISTSIGQWEGVAKAEGGDGVEMADEASWRYLSLRFKDDVLIGATAIGWTEHIGALRGLVQGAVRLGRWKARLMEDPTGFMAAYLAAAQKAA